MTKLERLEQEIYDAGVKVVDCNAGHPGLGGSRSMVRMHNGRLTIYIDKKLDNRLRLVSLAHEFGHIQTFFGGVGLCRADTERSEALAWAWAYERLTPERDLWFFLRASGDGEKVDLSEAADRLDVPAWFLDRAMQHYGLNDSVALRLGEL